MKRILKIILCEVLIIFLVSTYFYAVRADEGKICEIEEKDVYVGENFNLVINLENIKYESFRIVVESDDNTELIATDDKIETETTSDKTEIKITLKSDFTSKIKLVYKAPNEAKNIKFKITVINESEAIDTPANETDENGVEEIEENIVVNVKEKGNSKNDKEDENENKKDDKKENENNENNESRENEKIDGKENTEKNNTNFDKTQEDKKAFSNELDSLGVESKSNNYSMQEKLQEAGSVSSKTSSMTISSKTDETEEYKGDRNNYLSNLEISNFTLKNEFKKTTQTYFAEVENVDSIDVTAIAEDSSANVKIFGNSDLKTGINKVLIQVTAENGDIRNYKIFVNKK